MPKITALPAMTSADGADPAPIVDDSVGSTKKITLTKLKEWLQSLTAWITTAMITDANVTPDKWTNPYRFAAYRSAANTTNNAGAVVQYDTELFDTNNNFDSTTNKGRYTVPVTGVYHFVGQHGNSAAINTIMYCWLAVNGTQKLVGNVSTPGVANNTHRVSGLLNLSAGDYVEVYFIGGNGSTGQTGQANSYFHGFLVAKA